MSFSQNKTQHIGYKKYKSYISETDTLIEDLQKREVLDEIGITLKPKKEPSYETIEYYSYAEYDETGSVQSSNRKFVQSVSESNSLHSNDNLSQYGHPVTSVDEIEEESDLSSVYEKQNFTENLSKNKEKNDFESSASLSQQDLKERKDVSVSNDSLNEENEFSNQQKSQTNDTLSSHSSKGQKSLSHSQRSEHSSDNQISQNESIKSSQGSENSSYKQRNENSSLKQRSQHSSLNQRSGNSSMRHSQRAENRSNESNSRNSRAESVKSRQREGFSMTLSSPECSDSSENMVPSSIGGSTNPCAASVASTNSKSSTSSRSSSIRNQFTLKKSKNDSMQGFRNTLSRMDFDLVDKKREEYIRKWKEEDERTAREEQEFIDEQLFKQKPNKYKITHIKREHIEKINPTNTDKECEEYVKPPIAIPHDASSSFLEEFNKPCQERLCAPKRREIKRERKRVISKGEFDEFITRNFEAETAKNAMLHPKPEKKESKKSDREICNRLYTRSIKRSDADYDDHYLENQEEKPKPKKVKRVERVEKIKTEESISKEEDEEPKQKQKQKQKRHISQHSLMLTKNAPSFFERTSFNYADVINDYRKSQEEQHSRAVYQEQIDCL